MTFPQSDLKNSLKTGLTRERKDVTDLQIKKKQPHPRYYKAATRLSDRKLQRQLPRWYHKANQVRWQTWNSNPSQRRTGRKSVICSSSSKPNEAHPIHPLYSKSPRNLKPCTWLPPDKDLPCGEQQPHKQFLSQNVHCPAPLPTCAPLLSSKLLRAHQISPPISWDGLH